MNKPLKIFIVLILAVILFVPGISKAESCCICTAVIRGGSKPNTLAAKDESGAVFKDDQKCYSYAERNSETFGGYKCQIQDDSLCSPAAPPVMTKLEEEFKFKDIVLGVTIPSLQFSAPPTEVDEQGNIYIPWLGEYIKAIYNFSIVIISIIAVVVLIISGAQIITSAGGPAKAAGYKRISQAIIGLFIAWGSYVVLNTINPNLTAFKSLKIEYVEPEEIDLPDNSELSLESSSAPTGGNRMPAAETLKTLATIKGDNMIGSICGSKGTCGYALPAIADMIKKAAAAIKSKGCVVVYAASARQSSAQLDKVKKRCKWSENDKTYINCAVALGNWGSTQSTPADYTCRYSDENTPLPPCPLNEQGKCTPKAGCSCCDANALLHYKAVDAWATQATVAANCKEAKTGSRKCTCGKIQCIKDPCQRELTRAISKLGGCVLLGKEKNQNSATFEPWHFEIADPNKASFCFSDADSIYNSLGGTGF